MLPLLYEDRNVVFNEPSTHRSLCKDFKVIPSENLITEHKHLIIDIRIRKKREQRLCMTNKGLGGRPD